jgi:quercetin 2,3-dioxygenase
MPYQLFPAAARGTKDIGWLKSKFYFSFSDYYNPMASAFGTLVALNDDILEAGKGFGTHPHTNMEIISILLQGKMNHKDSMGYSTIIEEGGVQIMSAGKGLFHEEYNIGDEEVHFLQIWIQPKLQNCTPRYQTRRFPKASRLNQMRTIVSHEEGLDHCWINQNAKLILGEYAEPQTLQYHPATINKALFLLVITGSAIVNKEQLHARDAIGVWDTTTLDIQTGADTSFLLIETPINQK